MTMNFFDFNRGYFVLLVMTAHIMGWSDLPTTHTHFVCIKAPIDCPLLLSV